MITYILLAIIAAIVQIATIWALKVGFLKSFLFAIPFILLHQYMFTLNYTKAPNFLLIWFVTTGITALLSFLFGYLIFKNTLTIFQIAGAICILAGLVMMRF